MATTPTSSSVFRLSNPRSYAELWKRLGRDPTEAARLLTALIVHFLSVLTGEDRIFPQVSAERAPNSFFEPECPPQEELLRRVESGDLHVLPPVMRSDGAESERRRALVVRLLSAMHFLALFFALDPQYSPFRVVMVTSASLACCIL
jgi:hypothetical protein